MIRRPPRSTRTDPLFPYPTLFRSARKGEAGIVTADLAERQPVRDRGRRGGGRDRGVDIKHRPAAGRNDPRVGLGRPHAPDHPGQFVPAIAFRSEEHTSELQSLMRISYAVFCLKKKKRKKII